MFPYFILGIAFLLGVVLLARWFSATDPKTVVRALRWVFGILAVALIVFAVVAGRHALAILAAPVLFPLLLRYLAYRRRAKLARGPSPGQGSQVETRFFRMYLDHDSGEMNGEVLEGGFKGARLDELDLERLVTLWRECRDSDAQSAAVLEAYLDRLHGQAWRDIASRGEGGGPRAASSGGMSREEALEILGLEEGAGEQQVVEAHRRIMQKVHPDHGGSNYLAAKINEAKELLLRG